MHVHRAELKKELESLKEALASRSAGKRTADHMLYKVVQLNFTPEIEVFYMLF